MKKLDCLLQLLHFSNMEFSFSLQRIYLNCQTFQTILIMLYTFRDYSVVSVLLLFLSCRISTKKTLKMSVITKTAFDSSKFKQKIKSESV